MILGSPLKLTKEPTLKSQNDEGAKCISQEGHRGILGEGALIFYDFPVPLS